VRSPSRELAVVRRCQWRWISPDCHNDRLANSRELPRRHGSTSQYPRRRIQDLVPSHQGRRADQGQCWKPPRASVAVRVGKRRHARGGQDDARFTRGCINRLHQHGPVLRLAVPERCSATAMPAFGQLRRLSPRVVRSKAPEHRGRSRPAAHRNAGDRLAEHFHARINGKAAPPGPDPVTFADMTVLDAIRQSAAETPRAFFVDAAPMALRSLG
jgi:hypothetical protein